MADLKELEAKDSLKLWQTELQKSKEAKSCQKSSPQILA
jgi:hypothetical protein